MSYNSMYKYLNMPINETRAKYYLTIGAMSVDKLSIIRFLKFDYVFFFTF